MVVVKLLVSVVRLLFVVGCLPIPISIRLFRCLLFDRAAVSRYLLLSVWPKFGDYTAVPCSYYV